MADAGYGAVTEFWEGLDRRREPSIVGLLGEEGVLTEPPHWIPHIPKGARGRRPARADLAAEGPRPVAIHAPAETLDRTPVCWREGTKGRLEAELAWIRVWPAHRWGSGAPADAIPDLTATARWLPVEWRKDGTVTYALSNLPPDTAIAQAVGFWKERWQLERGYEQLQGELGLDHFEGRSWPGFHHHAAMTSLADGFLALERQRAQDARAAGGPTFPEEAAPGEARRGA